MARADMDHRGSQLPGSSNGPRLGRLYSPKKSTQLRKAQKEYTEAEVIFTSLAGSNMIQLHCNLVCKINDVLEGALTSGHDIVQTVRQLLEGCESFDSMHIGLSYMISRFVSYASQRTRGRMERHVDRLCSLIV